MPRSRARTGLPVPRAVFSVYPGRAFRGVPFGIPPAGPVPDGVVLRVLTGADDRVVDPRDARAILAGARDARPARWRRSARPARAIISGRSGTRRSRARRSGGGWTTLIAQARR